MFYFDSLSQALRELYPKGAPDGKLYCARSGAYAVPFGVCGDGSGTSYMVLLPSTFPTGPRWAAYDRARPLHRGDWRPAIGVTDDELIAIARQAEDWQF